MQSPPPSAPDSSSGPPCPHCGDPHPSTYTHCPNTGKALTTGRALIGRVIAGRYRVIGLLGEGGMGAVYVAEHTLIGRKVAIKRLHPELASDEKAVQRFQREARAAASTGHEHIVEILDLGYAEDGAPYLVMEYLRGQSLAALLRKENRLPAARACDLVGQSLAALGAVHRHQIVHRDLKPDNVFLTRRAGAVDWVKILDFGISKMKREEGEAFDLTRTGVMLGTPFYMSPEQARGMKTLDHRVDLYATGMILYECLTGRVPFEGDNYHQLLQAILRTPPPPPSSIAPDIDPALEAVIMKSIAKDPADRYQSAAEMLAALIPFGAHEPLPSEAIESAEGPAMSLATAMQATTPISPEGQADRLDQIRRGSGTEKLPERGRPATAPDPGSAHRSPPQPRPSLDADRARSLPSPPPSARLSAASAPTAPSTSALGTGRPADASNTPTPSGGARYFFAASDDWDEARARAIVEAPARSTPSFRDPASGMRDALPAREPSGSFGTREPSGSFATRGPSGSFGTREPSASFGTREPSLSMRDAGSSRDGGRLSTPFDANVSAVREQHASFAGQSPAPTDPWSVVTPARSAVGMSATGEVELKGSLVIAALEHLETAHGSEGFAQIQEHLDPESRARIATVILPMAWLPMSLYEQLLRGAERVAGGGEGSTASSVGRATADRELPTTHRLFMQTASPSAAAERIPQLYRLYHSRGEAKVLPTPGGGVRVEIDCGAPESLPYAWAISGFWQRMLELTGAREVRSSVVSCRGRGDDRTAIALRWR
ncbi:MAG: protein kinase [Myxococcota bacterium]|nr:protein kinase [Myxococcota bacterium]